MSRTIGTTDEDTWRVEFKQYLDEVQSHGEYTVSIPIEPPMLHPKITIGGMKELGRLSFLLCKPLAHAIRDVFEKAPFGKGLDTVLDETIRKSWQIDASKVIFHEKVGENTASPTSWYTVLCSTTQSLMKRLGLSSSQLAMVDTNLYKFLLYEEGGHFTKHRDTEKEPGIFGILLIQLPSFYEGGKLIVQHGGAMKKFDFAKQSMDGLFATAFFADC